MNILVFIKQVADTEARIIISGDNKTLEIENKYAINFFDEFAIEEAIRIKEQMKESQVTVCTYGPQGLSRRSGQQSRWVLTGPS